MTPLELSLIEQPHPFDAQRRRAVPVCWTPELTYRDLAASVTAFSPGQFVLVSGGTVVPDLDRTVRPGEIVHVLPYLGAGKNVFGIVAMLALTVLSFYVLPGAGGVLGSTAFSIGSKAVTWGMVAGFATYAVGGVLLNMLLPASTPKTPDAASPTYGWDPGNPIVQGAPIPIVYGDTVSTPQIIGMYLRAADNDLWYYALLAVAEGEAEEAATAEDILANDEPLTLFADHEVYATRGGNTVTEDVRAVFDRHFARCHQWRSFDKPLKSVGVGVSGTLFLTHADGSEGSTTLADETGRSTWTANAGAHITTTSPFLGTGCAQCTAAGDHFSASHPSIFAMAGDFTLETRFRRPAATDHGICGETWEGVNTRGGWGLSYVSGTLIFSAWRADATIIHDDDPFWEWNEVVTLSATAAIPADTWVHLALQRQGNNYRLYLDGTPLATAAKPAWIAPYPASGVLSRTQTIGRASRFAAPDTILTLDGLCLLDEIRTSDHCVYNWDGFTPPASPLAVEDVLEPETQVYTTRGLCDSLSLLIEFPQGLYRMTETGRFRTYTVTFRLGYRKLGTASWTYLDLSATDCIRSAARRSYEVTPEGGRGIYELRLRRVTADDTDVYTQSEAHWTGLDEMLHERLCYPNLQCVSIALKASERLSGGTPVFRVINRRRSVIVPAWDGLGTQTLDPRNPAWAALDLLTSDLYGLGLPISRIDRTSFEEWAAWCDGEVAPGTPRARMNGVLDTELSAWDGLKTVFEVGRASPALIGTNIGVVVHKPRPVSQEFTVGNMARDSFTLAFIPRTDRVDEIEIEFLDSERNWQRDSVVAQASYFDTLDRPARSQNLFLAGVNNREQAQREAILRMRQTELPSRTVEFEADVDAIGCSVGDVIRVQHDGSELTFGGRLARDVSGEALLPLDRTVTLASDLYAGNCTAWVRTQSDAILEAEVLGPWDVQTRELLLSLPLAASRFDVYCVGRPGAEKWLYQVVSVRRSSEQKVRISAVEYRDDIFYHPDYGGGAVPI